MKKGLLFLVASILLNANVSYAQVYCSANQNPDAIECYSHTKKRILLDQAVAEKIRDHFSSGSHIANCSYFENQKGFFTYTFFVNQSKYVMKCHATSAKDAMTVGDFERCEITKIK
jgi:S-ribosylhomocysteine lyase LuxS involved in autoinducer biosynthesis